MKTVGTFAGAKVSLDSTEDVRIVLRWRLGEADQAAILGLGVLLGGFARLSCAGKDGQALIRYTDRLDKRLVDLVDLLVAIRYAHPRMVQLPLALSEEEEEELREVMGV